jgi:hypothetical protein
MKLQSIFAILILGVVSSVQATEISQTIPQRFVFRQTVEPHSAEFPLVTEREPRPYPDSIDSFSAQDKNGFKILLDQEHCAQRVAYGTALILANSTMLKQLYTDLIQYGYFKDEVGEIQNVVIINSMKMVAHQRTDNAISIVIVKKDGTKFTYPSSANSSRDQMIANELLSENCDVFTEAHMVNLILSALIEIAQKNHHSSEPIINYAHQNLSPTPKWYLNSPFRSYEIDRTALDDNISFSIQLRQKQIIADQIEIEKLKANDARADLIKPLEDNLNRLRTLNAIEPIVATENVYLQKHFELLKQRTDYQKVSDEMSALVFKYFQPGKI